MITWVFFHFLRYGLEKNYNETCYIKNTIQLDNCIIPHGFFPHSIQGVTVDCSFRDFLLSIVASYDLIIDVFYMLRNRSSISLEFTNNPGQPFEKPSSISVYQCMVFLLPYYDVFSKASPNCRRTVVSNHYLSFRTLSKFNSYIDFSLFLSPSDVEHLLVVDRLFIQALRTLCPRPFIRLPSPEQTTCSPENLQEYIDSIPRHLVSLVDCIFRFCCSVFHQHHFVLFLQSLY